MNLYSKRKIEIVVEAPVSRLVLDVLDQLGASGYTVLRALAGRGHSGTWDPLQVTDARRQVMIVVVVGEELVTPIVEAVRLLFADYNGIILVSTVEVLRSERF